MSFSKDGISVIGVLKAEDKRRPATHFAPDNISNQSGSLTFLVLHKVDHITSNSLGRFQTINADQDHLPTNAQSGSDQVGHQLDETLKTLGLLNWETVDKNAVASVPRQLLNLSTHFTHLEPVIFLLSR